eukprot:9365246-Pyramimonas_sp.AAC.1
MLDPALEATLELEAMTEEEEQNFYAGRQLLPAKVHHWRRLVIRIFWHMTTFAHAMLVAFKMPNLLNPSEK